MLVLLVELDKEDRIPINIVALGERLGMDGYRVRRAAETLERVGLVEISKAWRGHRVAPTAAAKTAVDLLGS